MAKQVKQFHRCQSCHVVLRTTGDDSLAAFHANGTTLPGKRGEHACDGELVVDEGCHAVIFHGPGHQSYTRCEVQGEHLVHEAVYGSDRQLAEWTGDEVFSGFFNEPPEVEE